jgi:WD40 repeat protein
MALEGDGKHLVTGSEDKTAILWETSTGKMLATFQGHSGWVLSVALSGDGKYVVTGAFYKTAILWEVASGKKLQIFQGHIDPVTSVALSGEGKHLAALFNDWTVSLWQSSRGIKLQTFQGRNDVKGRNNFVRSVAVTADGKHLVTGSDDMTAILWEASSGKKLQTSRGHTDKVTSVALSGDGAYLNGSRHPQALAGKRQRRRFAQPGPCMKARTKMIEVEIAIPRLPGFFYALLIGPSPYVQMRCLG